MFLDIFPTRRVTKMEQTIQETGFTLTPRFHAVLCLVSHFTFLVAKRWYIKPTEGNAFETNGVSM